MKAWVKKLSGVLFASLLTVMLNGKAYANSDDIPVEENIPVIEEPASVSNTADNNVSETKASPSTDTPKEAQVTETNAVAETPKQETSSRVEESPAKEQPEQAAPSKEEPSKEDPSIEAPAKEEPKQEQTAKEEPARHEPVLEEPEQEKPADEEPVKQEPVLEQQKKDEPVKEDPVKEETVNTEPAKQEPVTLEPVNEEPVKLEPNIEEPVQEQPVIDTVSAAAPMSFQMNVSAPKKLGSFATMTTVSSTPDEGDSGESTQQEPILVIGTQLIDLDNDSSAEDDKWSYSHEDGSVVLKGFDGADQLIGTIDRDLTIKASGVNRIGTLVVDGDINIIGSGILLVDSIEMPSENSFNLMTNTTIYEDGKGSVAVFLKKQTTELDADGNETVKVYYELVNGSVTGILDENCDIPEGVSLVMPDGSSLMLQSVTKFTGNKSVLGEDGNYTFVYTTEYDTKEDQSFETGLFANSYSTTAPKLTIPSTSSMFVNANASISFNQIVNRRYEIDMHGGGNVYTVTYYTPSILVQGFLDLQASLEKALIEISSQGVLTSDSTLTDSTVLIDGGREEALESLSINDSVVSLVGSGASVGLLNVAGNSRFVYSGDNQIGSMTMAQGSTLTVQSNASYGNEPLLSITGTVSSSGSGATIVNQSAIIALEEYSSFSKVTFTNTWSISHVTADFHKITHTENNDNDDYLHETATVTGTGAIYDYKGILTENISPRIVSSPELTVPKNKIPAVITHYYDFNNRYDDGLYNGQKAYESFLNSHDDTDYFNVSNYDQILDYETLRDYYSGTGCRFFLLETEKEGRYGYTCINSYNDASEYARYVTRIRLVTRDPDPAQASGSSATDTTTLSTGSGYLGQNASSIRAGSGSSLNLSGFISDPSTSILPPAQPDPVTPDPVTPDPVTPDPVTPDPVTPDPVTPDPVTPDPVTPDPATTDPETLVQKVEAPVVQAPVVTQSQDVPKETPIWIEVLPTETAADPSAAAKPSSSASASQSAPADNIAPTVETTFKLHAVNGEKTLDQLGGKATITMSYTAPAEIRSKPLYVVFLNDDGSFTAIKANYSILKKELQFTTDRLGTFMIVGLDFTGDMYEADGVTYTEDFCKALEKLDVLQILTDAGKS